MQEEKRAAEYVNPFIGASTNVRDAGAYHGLGKTIPGATYPFGLVQLSPNTITGGDNGSGYSGMCWHPSEYTRSVPVIHEWN